MAAHNLVTTAFRPRNITEFPALMWNAAGESRVFDKAADVPDGFFPHPALAVEAQEQGVTRATLKDDPPAPKQAQPVRADVVAELQRRNIKFNAQSPTRVLFELLQSYSASET